MIVGRIMTLAAMILLTGCWPFKGKAKPAAPPTPLASSPRTIDSLWLAGQQLFNRGKWKSASEIFTRLATALPITDPRLPRLSFYRGEIELAQGNELDAIRMFRRLADETPDDSLAPDALLRAGDAYSYLWKRPELDPTYAQTALGVYQEVQTRYPNTSAAKRAEAKVRELNERFARKEYLSALFYYRFKAYDSAILLFRSLVVQYPRAPIVPEALEKLVLSYQALGYQEDIRETCSYIAQFHPDPKGPSRLCPKVAAVPADSVPAN
jgi:outer membrane protein assembly factor BamD